MTEEKALDTKTILKEVQDAIVKLEPIADRKLNAAALASESGFNAAIIGQAFQKAQKIAIEKGHQDIANGPVTQAKLYMNMTLMLAQHEALVANTNLLNLKQQEAILLLTMQDKDKSARIRELESKLSAVEHHLNRLESAVLPSTMSIGLN